MQEYVSPTFDIFTRVEEEELQHSSSSKPSSSSPDLQTEVEDVVVTVPRKSVRKSVIIQGLQRNEEVLTSRSTIDNEKLAGKLTREIMHSFLGRRAQAMTEEILDGDTTLEVKGLR